MLRERMAVPVLGALVVVAGCGGGGSDADSTTRDAAVVVSSVVDEPADDAPSDGNLREELSVDADGVGYQVLAGSDRRVVSYDQRGAGRSSAPGDLDSGLGAHVADLEAIRTVVGAEAVQLLGQSWSGAIASAYASTHPDRVSALILVGTVPLDVPEYLAGQGRFQARVGDLQQLGVIEPVLSAIDEGSALLLAGEHDVFGHRTGLSGTGRSLRSPRSRPW